MIELAANWWAFVLRGVIAVLFGVATFFVPAVALLTMVFLFGFYSIMDGVFNITAAFRRRGHDGGRPWWALLISGIAGMIAGAVAFLWPGITALALLFVIAAWAVVTGVMSVVAAIRLRKQIKGEWLLALAGVMSVVFGASIAISPGAGALALALWISAFALVYGVMLIAFGMRLRRWARTHPSDARSNNAFPSGVAPSY